MASLSDTPENQGDDEPEDDFCPHGVHKLSPCAECAEDQHGENRPL